MSNLVLTEMNRINRRVFRPSLVDLYFWFDALNDEVFDGILPDTELTLQRKFRGGEWAWTLEDENEKVYFAFIKKFKNKKILINVLAHEMVHLWEEVILGIDCDHGKEFMSWKPKFKEHGLKLEKAY